MLIAELKKFPTPLGSELFSPGIYASISCVVIEVIASNGVTIISAALRSIFAIAVTIMPRKSATISVVAANATHVVSPHASVTASNARFTVALYRICSVREFIGLTFLQKERTRPKSVGWVLRAKDFYSLAEFGIDLRAKFIGNLHQAGHSSRDDDDDSGRNEALLIHLDVFGVAAQQHTN